MIRRLEPIKLKDYTKLHVIKTDKFKTNLIGVYFQRPLLKEEASKNSLLSMILTKGTKNYPSLMEINRKMEDLYGAVLASDVNKKGERHIIQFKMQLPNKKYIGDKDILEEGLSILNEVINSPAIQNSFFIEEIFLQEKDNLKEKIKGRVNDKIKYAVDRCIEEMCKTENFSVYEYGDVEEVEKINNADLYKHYKKVLASSPADIFIVGDVNEDNVEDVVKKNIQLEVQDPVIIPREEIRKKVENVNVIEDKENVNQGKLTLGYRTNIPYESELYEGCVLFSNILGGGPNSKLFKNVREKESLCYYIFSKLDKFKSIMVVSSGIEFENYAKTRELIEKEIESLKKGHFTEEDIEVAKKSIINSIKSLTDAPNMLMDFYYSRLLSGDRDSIEEIINKIESVNKGMILEAGKEIELDTVYFLNKGKEVK